MVIVTGYKAGARVRPTRRRMTGTHREKAELKTAGQFSGPLIQLCLKRTTLSFLC